MSLDLFIKIVFSLVIGALVGIERQRRWKGELVQGLRTFIIVCLLGTLSSYFSNFLNSIFPLLIAFIFVGFLTILGYIAKTKRNHIGLTTEIAFLLTFLIGVLIFYDSPPFYLSLSIGILLAFILSAKEILHGFVKHLTIKEIQDAILFAIIAFVILPILPNKTIDPFNSINPFLIWIAVVTVLSISFIGYIFMKLLGPKVGTILTGLFGGLASSTSVALSMASNVKKNKKMLYSAVFAVGIASSTMFLRMILVSSIFNLSVALRLLLPLLFLGLAGYTLTFINFKNMVKEKANIKLKSPLDLKSAIRFGLLFAVVMLLSNLLKGYFGSSSIYIIALIAGLVDVDAVTISFSSLALTSIPVMAAVEGIILAGLSNTLSKCFLVYWMGTKSMGREVGKILLMLIALGLIILLIFI